MTIFASIELSFDLPVYPERVYRAWLDSYEHSRFTGQTAEISNQTGTAFHTLGGRVTGMIVTATPFDRIVQTWLMKEFPGNSPDSMIEVKIEPTCTGSLVTIVHSRVDARQTRPIMVWWEQQYLQPLRAYFDELVGEYVADLGDG